MKNYIAIGAVVALALSGCKGSKDKGAEDSGLGSGNGGGAPSGVATGAAGGAPTGSVTSFDWPATPEDYVFGPASYLHTLTIPDMDLSPCCRDWGAISKDKIADGTDNMDNALAALAGAAANFIDLQASITDTVQAGSFVALLDFYDLPANGEGDFHLVFHRGEMEPPTEWLDASQGGGTFRVDRLSFEEPTGKPRAVFASANITAGALTATDGDFEIVMPLSDYGSVLIMPLKDVSIRGDTTPTPTGVTVTNGELAGYVEVVDFYASYNQIVADTCGCLGLTGDLFVQDPVDGSFGVENCVMGAAAMCQAADEIACAQLAGTNIFGGEICLVLPLMMSGISDIDLDGDTSTYEALSTGLRFEGAEAEIVGLLP